jgi:hypothetical protein
MSASAKASPAKQVIPQWELEEYPLEFLFNKFMLECAKLNCEHDVVHGFAREYVSTFNLRTVYRQCFGNSALVETSICHRLRMIKRDEYPDDFMVFEETHRIREPKYYVNRLNKELMKRIFLPHFDLETRHICAFANLFEKELISMHELDEEED